MSCIRVYVERIIEHRAATVITRVGRDLGERYVESFATLVGMQRPFDLLGHDNATGLVSDCIRNLVYLSQTRKQS